MKASCSLILTALVATAVLPVRATTNYPVDAGATRTIDLGKAHNAETNPNSGGGASNLCNFQLGIGSTLKLTDTGSDSSVTFRSSFEFKDTTGTTSVTLDLTDLKGKPFNMEGNIYLADVAKLVIKGTNTFTFGHTGGIWPTYYPIFKVGHLEFQDKDGNVQPGKVVFTGQMIAFLFPAGWVRGTDYELTPGMELGVHENALRFPANGTIDLGPNGLNCDLAIVDTMESDVAGGTHANLNGVSIPASSTVVVPTGRTLVFNLQAYNPSTRVTESLYPAAGNRVSFGISLQGGTIKVTERNNLVHTGALTGYGKIIDGWSVSGANRGERRFIGPCEFTGTGLEVDYSKSLYNNSNDSYARLFLANVKNGSVLKSLNLGTQGHTDFAAQCGPTWKGLTGPAMVGHSMRYCADGYWRYAADESIDFTSFEPGSGATYTVADGQSVIGGAAASQIDVEAGSAVSVCAPGTSRMAINVKAGAEATLMSFASPILWVDASAAGTVSNLWIKANTPQDGANGRALAEQYCETSAGQPLVAQWHDVRAKSAYKLWSDRYDKPIAANVNSLFPHTHPYVATDGPNDQNYISFCGTSGNNISYALKYADGTTGTKLSNMARLFFYKSDYVFNPASTAGGNQTLKPRYVVMVFGAQGGGGHGLVGGANFYRAKTTSDGPIYDETTANKDLRAWVDGSAVDPRTANVLKSGWQVVTLELGGLSVDGLGFGKNNSADNGGQRYAEVLFFDRDLTDVQRQSVEIYLAEKWGLKDAYSYPATRPVNVVSLYGEGSVTVSDGGLTLGGAFKGTIDLNGKTATVDGAALPPDPSAVATDGLLGWFDPDDPQSLQTQEIATAMPTTRLKYINDRQGAAEGRFVMHSYDTSRAASIDVSAHGLGPIRTWIDYANYPGENVGTTGRNGNLTRLMQYGASGLGDQTVMEGVRTLMIVQDSRRGGGQPFFDSPANVNTDTGNYKFRTQYKTGTSGDKEASFVGNAWVWSPIYPAGCSSVLTAGLTYLNGIPVDGTKQGFTGRPEVLTVQTASDYPLRSFASLNNSEGFNILGDEKSAGEIEGEIILWNRTLTEKERQNAEAYLSYKWLGLVREGYSALGDATVTGSGALSAASVALLPKFDAGFAGTVKVTDADGFAFQLNTENRVTSVVKSVDLRGGTLDVSGAVAVTVSALGGTPRAGEYKLVGWAAAPTGVNWSLNLVGFAGPRQELCRLAARDDGLYLIIDCSGMMLILR